MIKDAKLKEMELYYDTGRLVMDACFSIKWIKLWTHSIKEE